MGFAKILHEGYSTRKYDIDKKKIEDFIDRFFRFIFFLEYQRCTELSNIEIRLNEFKMEFNEILCSVTDTQEHLKTNHFFESFPKVYQLLQNDAQTIVDNDPAAQSKEEVMFSYPGFFAIAVYRFAHELYKNNIPLIPRIWTEFAHSKTGIDINPGAQIGEHFFIDHGTGVVIGETTTIGDHVKLYQGVTLGALSTRGGQRLAGVKRHPTIEDNVTIYSNASVLGGETVIGEGSVIAGSTFVTFSVPPHSRVSVKEQEIRVRQPGERD